MVEVNLQEQGSIVTLRMRISILCESIFICLRTKMEMGHKPGRMSINI